MPGIKYCNTLIAVQDMDNSLRFYKDIFEQDVTVDLGWCKSLTCGLTLQIHFDQIAGFAEDTMHFRSNTMELYFETDDFDAFLRVLDAHQEVERLHEARTYPWQQRGIHIFDPDGHLIEVSESMYTVGSRQFDLGKTIDETAALTQFPIKEVETWHRAYTEQKNRR